MRASAQWLLFLLVMISSELVFGACLPAYKVEYLLSSRTSAPSDQGKAAAAIRPTLNQAEQDEAALASLSIQQLNALISVRTRLASVRPLMPPIGICADVAPNAFAFPAGTISESGAIIFSVGILRITGADENRIASVMAHEFAHIFEEHSAQKTAFRARASEIGLNAGVNAAISTRSVAAGVLVARQEAERQNLAFSRAIEFRADEAGYEMYIQAGFDPAEATRALETLQAMDREGGSTRLVPSHPPGTG